MPAKLKIEVTTWVKDIATLSAIRGLAYGIGTRNAVGGCTNKAWEEAGQRSVFKFVDEEAETEFFNRLKNILNPEGYSIEDRVVLG
jgi:hypothetical protein